MEVSRQQGGGESGSKWATVSSIARNIATNPIVFMTTLGMLANILFRHSLPAVIEGTLNVSTMIELLFEIFLEHIIGDKNREKEVQQSYWSFVECKFNNFKEAFS